MFKEEKFGDIAEIIIGVRIITKDGDETEFKNVIKKLSFELGSQLNYEYEPVPVGINPKFYSKKGDIVISLAGANTVCKMAEDVRKSIDRAFDMDTQSGRVGGPIVEIVSSPELIAVAAKKRSIKSQLDDILGSEGAVADVDYLLLAAQAYMDDGAGSAEVMDNLAQIDPEYINSASETYRAMYDKLTGAATADAVAEYADIAKNALKSKDYATAIENYQKAWDLDTTNSDNLMALAYAYRESGDTAKADELYRQVIVDFSETDNAMDAAEYLTNNE